MSEGRSARSDDLDEGVEVLDLVRVFVSLFVNTLHTDAFRGTGDTRLSGVNIVAHTVQESDDNHGGDTLEENHHVMPLVDCSRAILISVTGTHGPSERTSLPPELGVEASLVALDKLLVVVLVVLGEVQAPLCVGGVVRSLGCTVVGGARAVLGLNVVDRGRYSHLIFVIVLDHGVVGNLGLGGALGDLAEEESRALVDFVELECGVLLDNLGVNVGHEENRGQDEEAESDT